MSSIKIYPLIYFCWKERLSELGVGVQGSPGYLELDKSSMPSSCHFYSWSYGQSVGVKEKHPLSLRGSETFGIGFF
jgi:hypothetical protein